MRGASTGSELDLVHRAQAGDTIALEELVRTVEGKVYRFALKMCGSADEAADVVQETMLTLARSIASYREDASLSTWLYSIVRSLCIKRRRKSKFAPVAIESLETDLDRRGEQIQSSTPRPDLVVEQAQLRAAVEASIARLEPERREVLLLRDVEGLTTPETAAVLGLTEPAVKSRLHRARRALREQLQTQLAEASVPTPSPTCPNIIESFSKYLEGEIGPSLCAELDAHVQACERCKAECNALRRCLAICQATPEPTVPLGLRQAIARELEKLTNK